MQYRTMHDRSQEGRQQWAGKSSNQQEQEKKGPVNIGHQGSKLEGMGQYKQRPKGGHNKTMEQAARE